MKCLMKLIGSLMGLAVAAGVIVIAIDWIYEKFGKRYVPSEYMD